MLTEELARIRVDEAIQTGLRAQHIQRSLAPRKKSVPTVTLLTFGLAILLAISLGACLATANTPASTGPGPAATAQAATPPQYTITLSAETISIPDDIPAGLVELSIDNVDTQWHSAIIRHLNEDVSLEKFSAAFQEEPRSTFPMTSFIGGPDVPGGKAMPGYYTLQSGTYVVVDNWVEPWRFASFQVEGETAPAQPPQAEVIVHMKEYAFDMPESLPGGRQLWQFTNQGQFLHNLGIIRLGEGKSMDDVIAWTKEQQGPEPFEYYTMWNLLSPGATSWGEIELQPGEYLAVDFMPDFANEGGWNMEQGMVWAFTVAP
jgi:hypothetical protein